MKLAALCCTFHRPHLLSQLVESFLRQDYLRHLRELVILENAGYRDLGKKATKGRHKLQPGWPRDFTKLPVVKRFTCAPHVSHRDG